MMMFNARLELDQRTVDEDFLVDLHETLTAYHASVGVSERGWLCARISLPAENLLQATATATAVVERASGATAIAAEIMLEEEFNAREGFTPVPDLVSATEAAEILGVSRIRVNQMIDEHKFVGATKVGNSYVIPRAVVEAMAARRS